MLKLKIYKTKIPADIDIICPTVCRIMSYLHDAALYLSEDMMFEIKVILNELILNAIRHGNKEDIDKFVKITAAITSDNKLLLVVEDEGQGCDHEGLLQEVACSIDDMDLCEMKVSGRGLRIVANLCEKVRFNKKGNRIIVLKKLS